MQKSTQNKKIKNATPNTVNNIQFKSRLEVMVYETLLQSGFKPEYEKVKYVIWKGFKPTVAFYDKDKSTGLLKLNNKKIIDITYTPDFILTVGKITIIIEVKGLENDVFPIKKKLFRRWLESQQNYVYFEIYSKKQLLQAIEIIKNYVKD